MADQGEQYEMSWILHLILERYIGSRENVEIRRRELRVIELIENLANHKCNHNTTFFTGSWAEGITMETSDIDCMHIDNTVIVCCPNQDSNSVSNIENKTVFMMRNADSRPGYVFLELVNLGPICKYRIIQSIVPVQDVECISSEMFVRSITDGFGEFTNSIVETHGPATCLKSVNSNLKSDGDIVCSFPCNSWPQEASEWVSRPRLHGWPDKALINEAVRGGCHLVPVGDRTSDYKFLQWRISFTTAERKLMHSLTHTQLLIFGLLKYFLKQISDRLKQVFGDEDILSSYIMKTVILHAVESTPGSLWQEKNTFFCFMLCLRILITMVEAGHCPNYFISTNNMFHGKVQGENQQKLLHILVSLSDMKWKCLSVGTTIKPSLWDRLQSVRNGAREVVFRSPTESEMVSDMMIFRGQFRSTIQSDFLPDVLSLLYNSKSVIDEFLAYTSTVRALCCTGMETFEKHIPAKGNKEKYKLLRKCKTLITPLSSVCTSPGLLTLATYHYQTGNFTKSLEMCEHMISSSKMYTRCCFSLRETTMYEHLFCGRGYTLLHKYQEIWVSDIEFTSTALQFCPSQLHPELTNSAIREGLVIPPLPYAVFLTFLCYHELGDTRRRDAALIHLQAVKYDAAQGAAKHWIVHNILGTCYEMVGDKRSALREYRDSLNVRRFEQYLNPARARIERLQRCH